MPYRILLACLLVMLCVPASALADDTTPPHTTITQYPGIGETPTPAWVKRWGNLQFRRVYWPDDAVIAFQADEPATFECHAWDGPWYPCTSPVTRPTIGISIGGEHLFVRAIDQAGNVESEPAHVLWSIDPPNPIVPASVTGTFKVGQVLNCDGGQWPTPLLTPLLKEWRRDEMALMQTVSVSTGDTYTVTPDDVGKTVYCAVTLYRSMVGSEVAWWYEADTPRVPAPDRRAQLPASAACSTTHPAAASEANTDVQLDRECHVSVTSDDAEFYLDADGDASTGDPAHAGADRYVRYASGAAILAYWSASANDFLEAAVLKSEAAEDGRTTWTARVEQLGLADGATVKLGDISLPIEFGSDPEPPAPTPAPDPGTGDRDLTRVATLRNARPVLVKKPAVAGKAAVGHRLRCSKGTWEGSAKIAYRWTRNGKAIKGETASAYTVRFGDRGARIGCVVTARGKGGATTAAARTVAIRR